MLLMKIAIIDCIGLNYDGSTLTKKGIGGSESSIISIARELVKIGFEVTVLNDCDTSETEPGIYDGVQYYPIAMLGQKEFNFDVVISQRTVIPFTPKHLYDQVRQPAPRNYDPDIFTQVQRPEQLKIIWMQDTFIWGDHLLEYLLVNNYIDEVFNLSDWHIAYTTNCTHGPKRQYEVFKNKIFHTRNAINRWIDWVDIKQKDPNLFVYNASITKGMIPLVTRIWPRLKQHLPQAKLKIIGGYYKFRNEDLSPAQQEWHGLVKSCENDPSIEFTGIIPQPEIAKIMAQATYNLFPGAYPETSGISIIESINYNTPVIGTRFGAMEESGTEAASYFIDYAVEPNVLFPNINTEEQINKYVDLVLSVVRNPYVHQQKQYACNAIKEVSTWDTVALQWKQHFYRKFNKPMDYDELVEVRWINYRVRKTFGRRFSNIEDIVVLEEPGINLLPLPQEKKVRVAYIDITGMSYDGNTLRTKGLGGSESAVILSSRELAFLDFDVTVYCACDEEGNSPGIIDGVMYRPLSDIGNDGQTYDVLISSRVVTPFITKPWYGWQQTTNRKIPFEKFEKMRAAAKLKVFWMHDTFCWGDEILEDLVASGAIDEIWTLSDFHYNYVTNCNHGKPRNFEVLRKHMWITRNGITQHPLMTNTVEKDPDLFMFNANMSKGLEPLLKNVWPKVKEKIPKARLVVIGGHYKLGNAVSNDTEESEFMKLVEPFMEDPTITFTGIISQKEVAVWCKAASFFIYPTAFPETYGISTLEALYANTLIIGCRFGALEETGSPQAYMIEYSATPNVVYPNIDPITQADKFVDMVVTAYNDPDRYKRAEALNEIKSLVGWEVVALEWKQHIYKKLGLYLSRGESVEATYTKSRYHQVFNRRTSTPEEWLAPKLKPEQRIVVISPFYNAEAYIEKCIASVAAQDYDRYEHWLIDDCSTDNGRQVALDYINKLAPNVRNKFQVLKNSDRMGAPYNHMKAIKQIEGHVIVILLDGDDSLVNSPDIFTYYNHLHYDYDFTYGSCWSMVDNIPLVSQPYPPHIMDNKQYKDYKFNWNVPYTHLRTLKARLLKWAPDSTFQDEEGNWFKAGGDLSTFYTAINNCDPHKVYVVSDIVCNYNDASPINDYKVNKDEQDKAIMQTLNSKKKILIAIPTNKNIEAQTFKSIYDLIIPEGYEVDFQYFYGYQVDQIRNLIASWVVNYNYDYLFAIDSDIAFAPDTLVKMLNHNVDMVSGIYIQRIPGTHTIELMRKNATGGMPHVDWDDIRGMGLVEVDGCGFGCVLIKGQVFKSIPYPHFVYKSALDHKDTVSEDVYFCVQAKDRGFKIWADTSIICDHIGSCAFKVDNNPTLDKERKRLRELGDMMHLFPQQHMFDYLDNMRLQNIEPKVIYDIGACVLHWTTVAKNVWPDAKYFAFDAMDELEFYYKEKNIPYHVGLLSDLDNERIGFYQNTEHPAGNSYYKENTKFSPTADKLFPNQILKIAMTLDTVVKQKGFPPPDLIKMDVQGAELDIIKGARETLKSCNHLILELQNEEYNINAPMKQEVIDYLKNLGFVLKTPHIMEFGTQGDYHFVRELN
jgi:FkbM family methyltransferase